MSRMPDGSTPTLEPSTVQQLIDFHGHLCPGLSMGAAAGRIALREIGPHATDEEVVCVTETDMCGVDAVQVLTGCTFGKGNLIHRDVGKNAFTFWRRSDGRAVRVVARSGAWTSDPEHQQLSTRVRSGEASEDERIRFRELHVARGWALLDQPPDDLYDVQEVGAPAPRTARLHTSLVCDNCREAAMETRIRHFRGQQLCQPCFDVLEDGDPVTITDLSWRTPIR